MNPHTGTFGSATDPDSWTGFEDARTYAIEGAADGLGFVFTEEDPVVGVDLDDCRVPETGTLTDDASAIVETLDSYTEISPSGTGVHVLVEGTVPGDRNRRDEVEIYETARFFTVTGNHVDGTPLSIERRYDELREVHAEYVAPDENSSSGGGSSETVSTGSGTQPRSDEAPDCSASSEATEDSATAVEPAATDAGGPDGRSDLTDTELLERAKSAENGEKFSRLWRGETSGYESHSEADMALCALLAFWSGGDEHQIDRLFRDSGLMREKWDERHYADGSTYGEKTIERVIAGTDEFYDPNPEPEKRAATDDPFDAEGVSGSDEMDPSAEAIIHRLRQERDELETREQDHLDLIDDLRAEVERLEADNDRLRAELEELRDSTAEENSDTNATSTSPTSRFWQWLTDGSNR